MDHTEGQVPAVELAPALHFPPAYTAMGVGALRVLFLSRPDIFTLPAGDTVQLLETMKGLRALGVHADHSGEEAPKVDGYAVVHLFNIMRVTETFIQCQHIVRGRGRADGFCYPRIVISPIYWNMEEYLTSAGQGASTAALELWRRYNPARKAVLEACDMILPNAEGEARLIQKDLGITKPYRVVPNGADPRFAAGDAAPFVEQFGMKDVILCVGRISRRKNQLGVIRALRDTELPLVFIGPVNDPVYFEECRQEAPRRALFLKGMPHEELPSAYKAARVHVLASWYETPGLASLEAGMAGCRVVTTDRGTAREYFGNLAWYCDPGDTDSIRQAVIDAYEAPETPSLSSRLLSCYTWNMAAQRTLEAYNAVV